MPTLAVAEEQTAVLAAWAQMAEVLAVAARVVAKVVVDLAAVMAAHLCQASLVEAAAEA